MTDPLGPRGGRPVLPPHDPTGTTTRQTSGGSATAASAATGEPRLIVTADGDALAEASAVRLAYVLAAAVERRGLAHVALTGGSTPRAMYGHLVRPHLRDLVDWSRVHLWWGDDRYVPRTDPLSNVILADETILASGGLSVPKTNVHPFPTDRAIDDGLGVVWCAATYAAEVLEALPSVAGWPAFDLVLLGLGPDGHLLSVFPGSAALTSDLVGLAIPAPTHVRPHVERVTLNPAILDAAGHVLLMAGGAGKAEVVARILTGPRDAVALPAVLARRGNATWLLDAAAASGLGDPR